MENQKVLQETAETTRSQESLSAELSGQNQELNNEDRHLKVLTGHIAQIREKLKVDFSEKVAIFYRAIADEKRKLGGRTATGSSGASS